MHRQWLSLAAGFLIASASLVSAQTGSTRVSLADSVRTALPGTAVSYMFTIESPDGAGGVAEVSLPPEWRTLTASAELPQGSPRISYLVAAGVPATATPGRYLIELIVRQAGRSSRAAAWVIVPARHALSLTRMHSPEMVVAGSPVIARFMLANRGNAPVTVRLNIKSATFSVSDTLRVTLAPGASQEIPVELATDSRAQAIIQSTTSVTAQAVGLAGISARSAFQTSVVPREAHAAAPVHTLSSRIRMIGASSSRGARGAELFGSGLLRDGSLTRIEYLARTMAGGHSLYGDRDEYRLAIESDWLSVKAGDQVSTLSTLSENGRYARAVRTEVKSNGWTLGGFFNRDGSLPDKREQRALFLNRDFGNGVLLAVNFLDRKEPRGGTVLTARTTMRSLPFGTVEAELGHAINSVAAGAWMVSANGTFRSFSYSAYRQKSDSIYPGATRGTATANATLDVRPLDGVRIFGSFRDHRAGREYSLGNPGIYHNWNRSAAVTLVNLLTVNFVTNGVDRGRVLSQYAREEKLTTVRAVGKAGGIRLNASATFGKLHESGFGTRSVARYSAGAGFRKGQRAAFSVTAEALRGGTLFAPGQHSELRGGVNASLDASGGSKFSISAHAGERRTPGTARDATLEARWDQDLMRGHHLTLSARLHRNPAFESAGDNVLRAEYTLPFGLPVGASRSRGRVTGRLYSVETGAAIMNAVIQLGTQVAVTDARGRFAFSTGSENELMLNLGGSPATAGWIPVRHLPLTVVPRTGRTSSFDIAMTRAAAVSGKVRLFVASPGFRPGDQLPPIEEINGLALARITLTRDGDTRSTTSNSHGEFTFTDLRPGTWALKIVEKDLPRFSLIEGDSVVVTVAQGTRVVTEIKVLPRKRKITIVQG